GPEAEARGEGVDAVAELARGQGREPVEDRREERRVDPGGEEAHAAGRPPRPHPPPRARPPHYPQHGGAERPAEDGREQEALHEVEDEAAGSLAVEAVPGLHAERRVERKRKVEEHPEQAEDGEEREAGGDRAEAEALRDPLRSVLDEPEAAR